MKKNFYKIISLSCLITLNSCFLIPFNKQTHTISVKQLKPAKVNLGKRKKIAVVDFDFSGNIRYAVNLQSNVISDTLISSLIQTKNFTIVERSMISKVITEQGFSLSGFVDNSSNMIKVGKILGADAIITGSGSYLLEDYYPKRENVKNFDDGSKVIYQEIGIERKSSVTVNYRVIDVQTGEVLGSKDVNRNGLALSEKYYPLKVSRALIRGTNENLRQDEVYFNYVQFYEMTDIREYSKLLTDPELILKQHINSIAEEIKDDFTPKYRNIDFEIEEGSSWEMNQAFNLAQKNLWETAKQKWEEILLNPNLKRDYISALNNLGIYYEMNGLFDQAKKKYSECIDLSNDNDKLVYKNNLNRAKEREIEVLSLQEQGKLEELELKSKLSNYEYIEKYKSYMTVGKYDLALNILNRYLSDYPTDTNVYYYFGLFYKDGNNIDKAESYFKQALKYDNKSQALKELKEIEELKKPKEIKKEPNFLDNLMGNNLSKNELDFQSKKKSALEIAVQEHQKGNIEEALIYYQKAIEVKPNDFNVYNNIATIYYLQKNYKESLENYNKAIKINPSNSSTFYNIALVYNALGKKKEYIDNLKKACKLGFKEACK